MRKRIDLQIFVLILASCSLYGPLEVSGQMSTKEEELEGRTPTETPLEQTPTPKGHEFDAGQGRRAKVATDYPGNFHVVFEHDDTSGSGVSTVFFNPYGGQLGLSQQVNEFTTDEQAAPDVAFISNDDFVVVWHSYGQDGDGLGVYGRLLDVAGPQGSEFQISMYTTGNQANPKVVGLSAASGSQTLDFAVVWEDPQDGDGSEIFCRKFVNAKPHGIEFRVNTFTTGDQLEPVVASSPLGGCRFVIVWQSSGQDGSGTGVFGQLFSNGEPQGSEFQVNTYTTLDQGSPTVAYLPSGDFLVVWESQGQDSDDHGVFGQRFDSNANPLGGEFQVNTYTSQQQEQPSVTVDPLNNFVVVWASGNNQDGDGIGVFGQTLESDGAFQGSEFRVNTSTLYDQTVPDVTSSRVTGSGFVVVWENGNGNGNPNVVGRVFSTAGPLFADGFESGNTSQWSTTVGFF